MLPARILKACKRRRECQTSSATITIKGMKTALVRPKCIKLRYERSSNTLKTRMSYLTFSLSRKVELTKISPKLNLC